MKKFVQISVISAVMLLFGTQTSFAQIKKGASNMQPISGGGKYRTAAAAENATTSTNPSTTAKYTLKNCDGEVVVECNDPDCGSCADWQQSVRDRLGNNTPEANYVLNNHDCVESSSSRAINIHTTPCVEAWFNTQTFTQAQLIDLLSERAKNPQKWDAAHCMEKEMATPKVELEKKK